MLFVLEIFFDNAHIICTYYNMIWKILFPEFDQPKNSPTKFFVFTKIIQRELKYLHYLTLLVPYLPHLAQNCLQIPWQSSGKDQGRLTMDVMSSDPSRRNQANDENASNFDCNNHTKRHSSSIKYTFYQTRHHPK